MLELVEHLGKIQSETPQQPSVLEDGQERPVALPFCIKISGSSRMQLLATWQRSVGDCIWCERFHGYLFGCHFTILCDHKPLELLLREISATDTTSDCFSLHIFHPISSVSLMIPLLCWLHLHAFFQACNNLVIVCSEEQSPSLHPSCGHEGVGKGKGRIGGVHNVCSGS